MSMRKIKRPVVTPNSRDVVDDVVVVIDVEMK